MASQKVNIETNEKPLDKNALDELIRYSGYDVHMILQYTHEEGKGVYLIYAKYHNGQVTRQVYTQRNTPRNFKDIQRAIDWGKRIGFRTITLTIDYGVYPDPDSK
ncbi:MULTISPECIES: hypothetical protein [Vibrio]|uniref:hypothetical protein n=1 Tax=Vibrio TaxID=662 RepID=UPI0005C23580|nr:MULTISPECIES: hypothetical protein [Vibrio]EJG1004483.1 hypothetical protein [Vibrio parahaemolyticus]ELC3209948.1 hypothetical protein [Vibrio parahaemolyticus]KIV21566.1 hypothetical protein SZ05_14070 [Vibrio parahaemolyticus]MBO1367250.1 hypothetical protein [Vibrio cholerae]MBO1371306.1 hypothetical protein [Vibrio cholerae]